MIAEITPVEPMERGMPIPVHTNQPTSYAPIHADDISASIPFLLSVASTPATVVNWAGDEVAGIEDWCGLMAEITGLTATFAPTDATIAAIIPDLSRLHGAGFRSAVAWRDGIRRMVTTSRPDLVRV